MIGHLPFWMLISVSALAIAGALYFEEVNHDEEF